MLFVSADDCRFFKYLHRGSNLKLDVPGSSRLWKNLRYGQHSLMKERITRKKKEKHVDSFIIAPILNFGHFAYCSRSQNNKNIYKLKMH